MNKAHTPSGNIDMSTKNEITSAVRDQYAATARSGLSNDSEAVRSVAAAFGYSAEELASLPAEANMGLSCGNPVALASLRPGEVVVDLGCGGGMDVFLAAKKVGSLGRVIGIDMTEDMLARARTAAERHNVTNVEFHLAEITKLPLPDNSVDCIISNCVINLVTDKDAAFREMWRVLKPGGRVALSDIALKKTLPPEIKASIEAYVGCISGAILIHDYRSKLEAANFESVVITDTGADLNVYAEAGVTDTVGCCTAPSHNLTSLGIDSGKQPANSLGQLSQKGSDPLCLSQGLAPFGIAGEQPTSTRSQLPVTSSGCCDSTASATASGCCGSGAPSDTAFHEQLGSVLKNFDANAHAASVRVQALKPQ
jgi:SAM-dependent methyltransferase